VRKCRRKSGEGLTEALVAGEERRGVLRLGRGSARVSVPKNLLLCGGEPKEKMLGGHLWGGVVGGLKKKCEKEMEN